MSKAMMTIVEKAQGLSERLREWRRTLHQYPELSFREAQTARFVEEVLRTMDGLDIQTKVARTGIVATLKNGDGPVVALRADMDALPIREEEGRPYGSRHDGVMHACGHDAHTAILLGAAQLLTESFAAGELHGTVKLLFQPAEEDTDERGLSGAPHMIREGVLEGVDAAFALHMCPWLSPGDFQIHDGFSMANVDVFEGVVRGTGGHGAYPHLGTDPVWMMTSVLQTLYGIVNRRVSPLEPAVVSIGEIRAGSASNVIPTEAFVRGTIRTYDPEVREALIDQVRQAFSLVKTLGGTCEFRVERGEPALDNHPLLNRWLEETMRDLYPKGKIRREPFGLGGEDFGYMTREVPGAMFFLGCGLPDGRARDLHTPAFDIDERCLPIGAAVMAETAKRMLSGRWNI